MASDLSFWDREAEEIAAMVETMTEDEFYDTFGYDDVDPDEEYRR